MTSHQKPMQDVSLNHFTAMKTQTLKESTSPSMVDLGNQPAVGVISHEAKKRFWSHSHQYFCCT